MSVVVRATELPEVLIVEPARHRDARGFFSETWNARALAEAGIEAAFVQDNHAGSAAKGTVRGFHFQRPPHAQAKLVRVVRGAVFDVVVDIRVGSPRFGRWAGVELSAENWRQLWAPEGFAHAYCTLTPDAEVLYKTTGYYAPDAEGGLALDDPDVGVDWPIALDECVIHPRDKDWPRLGALQSGFVYEG